MGMAPLSGYHCPACEGRRALAGRRLGQAGLALFECSGCGGLWLGKEIFEALAGRARSGKLPDGFGGCAPIPAEPGAWEQPFRYRPCAMCGVLMNRRNYGRRSGVILDVCARHGLWFDRHELDRLLRWISEGGEAKAEKLQREQERIETPPRILTLGLQPWEQPEPEGSRWDLPAFDLLLEILGEGLRSLSD